MLGDHISGVRLSWMIRAAAATFVMVSAVLAACSTFSSSDQPGTTPDHDAASDATAVVDASIDAWPAGAVFYEGFEVSPACAGFANQSATLEHATDQHFGAGTASCKVCTNMNQGGATRDIKLAAVQPIDKSIRLEAHVRPADDVDAAALSAWLHISLAVDGGYVGDVSTYPPLDAGVWTFAQSIYPAPAPFDTVSIGVGANGLNTTCVYIDDVTLFVE
jgi:hypothetical protein